LIGIFRDRDEKMKRPNILFAFADDWGRYASAYRRFESENSLNNLIETPNFDRVAKEGVIFTNAFVQAPSCTPCRSSILSGQYFWQTGLGAILTGAVWDERIPSYPLELEKAGYHIGYTYKVWSPGRTKNAPYGAERTRYEPAGDKFWHFSQNVTKLVPEMGVEAAKEVIYDETRQNFRAFLNARKDGQPFCYWWGPMNTHRQWERGSGKALWNIDPDTLKGRMPAFIPDTHDIREDFADYLGECMAVDGGLGVLMKELENIGELDNTLIVVSGDHGIPGFPRAKCNLYDIGCEVALAMRWPGRIKPGRTVEDFVSLMELAPTFMEAAGEPITKTMTAKSLMPVLVSEKSGQIELERTFVILGRERHAATAREGNLPYPQRALRTKDFLYIRNFAPDRWPMGDPLGMDNLNATPPPFEKILSASNGLPYRDMDPSPTKAWMVHHRSDDDVRELFELAFGKRPAEELYDLRKDPYYMNNVANLPEYKSVLEELSVKLMNLLKEQNDPRVCEAVCRFEHAPYTNEKN